MNISAAPWSGSLLNPTADAFKAGLIAFQLLLGLALVSCTSLAPPPATDSNRQAVAGLDSWTLRGRLNIRSDDSNDTANINWLQTRSEYDINLSGTLGLGAVRISGGPGGVVIEKAGDDPIEADSLEAITADMLGYAFPASELYYWIRAIPAPGNAAQTTFNPEGLTATLSQADARGRRWELQYDRYRDVQGYPLPGRIRLEQPPYRLTFVISDWELPEGDAR